MSTSISGGYGILPSLLAYTASVHQQLDTLTEQVSSGLVSQTYAGLGAQAAIALDLSPQIAALQADQTDIGQSTGAMKVAQGSLTQIEQIAQTFADDIPNLNGLSTQEVDSTAAQARSALQQVADLLNTRNVSNYVFSGQDTGNPPVPSGDQILTSGFFTQINAAVAGLSTNGAAATIASTLAVASSDTSGTTPFSTYLSQPASDISPMMAANGEGGLVQVGLLANTNLVAVSSGTSTTGSYLRDLMRSLATLGSLSSSQINAPGFGALVQDTGTSLTGAVNAMAEDVGILGNTQANLTAIQAQLSHTQTALSGQLSNVQDVDMATALGKLSTTQTQLQASYRMIASANSLSLLNYLAAPTG